MRQAHTLVTLLALLAFATAARAAGVSLRWDSCYGDGGIQNKNFACDTNAGSETLVGSFTLSADLPHVSGTEIVLDLAFAGTSTPRWWAFFNVSTCRRTSLTFSFAAPGACVNWADSFEAGGIGAYNIGNRGPNTVRVVMATAVPPGDLKDLSGGQEYFSFRLAMDNLKTVGDGSCAGCTTPGCLVIHSIRVTTQVVSSFALLDGAANGTDSDWATWQGGAGVGVGLSIGCPAATPTARRTWGSVKALYR